MLKILGGIDLIFGLILVLLGIGIVFPKAILIVGGIILLIKSSFGFLKDFASWIDLVGGVIFILLIFFGIPEIIVIIVGLFIVQKGVSSFL